MTGEHIQRVHTGSVVLDIGDDAGSLVIYVPDSMLGVEVEVLHRAEGAEKVHTDVVEWQVHGPRAFAAVFPPLPIGEYRVCRPEHHAGERLTLRSGAVTEVDWR